jgi:UMF1 family MFS transporter
MDICGKGASFLGTTLVAIVSQVTAGIEVNIFGLTLQNENLAVGSLIVLFIIGYLVFCKADSLNKARQTL